VLAFDCPGVQTDADGERGRLADGVAARVQPAIQPGDQVAIRIFREPELSGEDNLKTMALVEACYRGGMMIDD
jgi:hypothetical protein